MEFDQAYNGSVDWAFPSPTATPTAPSYGNHVLQTPKTATYPSHFQDAFTTPQMPGYATPQQPQYSSVTPVLRSNFHAQFQGSHGQEMQPPGQPGYYETNINSPMQSNLAQMHLQAMSQGSDPSLEYSQMQTPPPTRGTSIKKSQPTPIAFGTPSTIASRRFVTPQQQVTLAKNDVLVTQQTPMHFPQWPPSAHGYPFANVGPASAPLMSHSHIFWDQTASPDQLPQQRPLDDPFAPNGPQGAIWQDVQHSQGEALSFDTPMMASFPTQPLNMRPSFEALSGNLPSNQATPATSASLNPSLIYSSPIRPVVRSANPRPQIRSELSVSKTRPGGLHSGNGPISTNSGNALHGAGLQRSNTTGTAQPQTTSLSASVTDNLGRSNSISQPSRIASPLKRVGKMTLGSISEGKPRHRASVVLTIDENGRARTETRRRDNSPTKSLLDKYPGLFDSDSSPEESDGSEHGPSRIASFTFAKGDERRIKAARLDPPVENLEGLSIPRPASSSSVKGVSPSRAAIAAAAQLRRQCSIRRSAPGRNNSRRSYTNTSTTSLLDTGPMDGSDQYQASMVMAESASPVSAETDNHSHWSGTGEEYTNVQQHPGRPAGAANTIDVYNRRWSMMSFEQHQNQPSVSSYQNMAALPGLSAAPTLVYPTTGTPAHSHGHDHLPARPLIRCICGVSHDRGQMLIQCSSCTQWLHAPCVGVDATHPPTSYICYLCTKPMPGLQT